jgi:hypothetical protein
MGVGGQKHAAAQMTGITAAHRNPFLGPCLGKWELGYRDSDMSGCGGTGPESLNAIRWL